MKMKIDLGQFKLKHRDEKTATLIHPHGHEFKVAIHALHPLNRKNLESLEKHESPELKVMKSKETNSGAASQSMPMADGGKVSDKKKLEIEPINPVEYEAIPQWTSHDSKSEPVEAEPIKPEHPVEYEKMADGGDVEQQPPVTVNVNGATQQPQVSPEQLQQNMAQNPTVQPQNQPNTTEKQPEVTKQEQIPQQQPAPDVQATSNSIVQNATQQQLLQNPNDPWGNEAMNQAAMSGLAEQKQGLALEAQGRKKEGQEVAKQGDAAVKASQDIQQQQNTRFDELNQKRQHLAEDLNNQHIDPQRYLSSMSTGDKIQSAIGLILGGIGGAHTGGNPALEFLNKQIDRDIDAQRAELGKKESLLSANLHDFGNLRDAMDFTRINHNDIVSYQMKAAAARQQGTMGSADLLKQAGILDYNSAQLQGQMAMRRTLLGQQGQGSTQVAPESKIRALVPAGPEQDKYFKELDEAQKTVKTKDNLLQAFDKVAQMQTLGSRLANPVQSASRINALVEPLTAGMSKETAGRYTEQDAHAIKNLWPKLSDNAESIALKRQQLERINNEKMNFAGLKSLGISPEGMSKYQGPADIKTLNGVKYQKVSGGWKKLQ